MPLTRKGLAYLGLAYAFIGVALAFREPSLTSFVIPIALLLFWSKGWTKNEPNPLVIKRRLFPERSFGGESISVTVNVSNRSSQKLENIYLDDFVPEPLLLEAGTKALAFSLKPGDTREYSYMISAPKRGSYSLGPMSCRLTDLFGFRAYSSELSEINSFNVLPKIERLGPVELRARRFGPWPGMVPSRRIGVGSEFFELRLYSQGDDLRWVNWKASAKQGHLVTNEFEREQVTDVLVVLDCSEGTLSRLFDFDALEFQVSFAASVCSQLILQGNRVGLSVYGPVRTWVDLGFGRRNLLRILDNLAMARAGKALVPMDYAVQSVIVAVVPSRSVIVFISPVMGEEIVRIITDIAIHGYSTLCFTPSIADTSSRMPETERIARRILAAERRLRLMHVAKCARLMEFSPQTPIKSMLRSQSSWRVV
jgi:uncharacterized protein (DUF58 family)